MRRGQVVRRTRSRTGSLRDQQANHNQQQRPGRRRGASRSTVRAGSTGPGYSVEQSSIPLRRSARLNPVSGQSLGNRAVEAEASRHQRRRQTRRLHNSRNSTHAHNHTEASTSAIIEEEEMTGSFNHVDDPIDGPGRSYFLRVAVQPPRVAQVSVPLYPPLAIRVHICDAETGNEISGEDEFNIFAQATLYGESINSLPLAPPDIFLLSGQLSMTLDLLNDGPGESGEDSAPLNRQQGSYVIFPDLVINRTGRYRLGVSLFKIGSSRRGRSPGDPRGGGTFLEEVKSDVIIVQENSAPTQIDPEAQQFLEHIRNRGATVPSPPRV